MQAHYRDILPAPTLRSDSSRTSDEGNEKPPLDKRKGKLVKIACRICQRRRVKCDGQRPGCSACKKRGEVCLYDFNAAADTTRYQALRKKHIDLEQLCNQNVEVLDLLRQRSRAEALVIFEQIRRGSSLEELLRAVKDGDLLIGLSSPTSLHPTLPVPDFMERRAQVTLPPLMIAVGSVDMGERVHVQESSPRVDSGQFSNVGWLRA